MGLTAACEWAQTWLHALADGPADGRGGLAMSGAARTLFALPTPISGMARRFLSFRHVSSEAWSGILFVVVVSITAHLFFSWMGFNPTDDGFSLAYARRLLEGQTPHADFITLRPVLSPLMHMPEVMLGGDYAIWIGRLSVWIQLACIAWWWVAIPSILMRQKLPVLARVGIGVIAFCISAHSFPIMPWHTIDGLFLVSLGTLLCVRSSPKKRWLGYFILALAYLTKQSFLLVAPLVIFLMNDFRSFRCWAAILLPAFLYGALLMATGALADSYAQLAAHTNAYEIGVLSYTSNRSVLHAVIVGAVAGWLVVGYSQHPIRWRQAVAKTGALIMAAVPFYEMASALSTGSTPELAFILWGFAAGICGYLVMADQDDAHRQIIIGFCFALIASWSASISLGYATPILGAAGLIAAIAILAYRFCAGAWRVSFNVIIAVCALFTVQQFFIAREQYIYRQPSVQYLTKELGEVFPGGKGIRTDEKTYALLGDLQGAIHREKGMGKIYAILPDLAGYWVKAPETNPLPIDWALSTELPNELLTNKVIDSLNAKRGSIVVLIQKVRADTIALGGALLGDSGYSPPVTYVKKNFTRTGDTRFFEIYE
ncbi:MAG: hypothetical protein EXR77_19175 [Myxococcales bacterium]|nr:hypothetical protein [Myxococcales bacterium]